MQVEESTLFFGIVEDVKDPLMLGRVRVRAYGYHTDNKGEIPTNMLPWSPVSVGNSAGVSGVGFSATNLVQGSFVVGMFLDKAKQNAIILGSVHSAPNSTANSTQGFNDPDGQFPRYAGESDVNKLARGEDTFSNPLVSGSGWSEPKSPYAAQYPLNHVYESESGHIFEFDDTTGAERIRLAHKNGSFFEYHDDGTVVEKATGDLYTLALKDAHVYAGGKYAIDVGSDATFNIGGKYSLNVSSTFEIDASKVTVSCDVEVDGTVKATKVESEIVDAKSITTDSIVAKGGSVGGSSVQQLFLSPKSSVPISSSNAGRNDPAKPRVAISDMKSESITDDENNFFTKSDEVAITATTVGAMLNRALVGVKQFTTTTDSNGLPSINFYASTGETDESNAGKEITTEEGTFVYDALGQEFKNVPVGGSGGFAGNIDDGEF